MTDEINVSGIPDKWIKMIQKLVDRFREDKELNFKAGKEAIVFELLKQKEILQGKAAELLGIDKHDLFDLMAEHNIPNN